MSDTKLDALPVQNYPFIFIGRFGGRVRVPGPRGRQAVDGGR